MGKQSLCRMHTGSPESQDPGLCGCVESLLESTGGCCGCCYVVAEGADHIFHFQRMKFLVTLAAVVALAAALPKTESSFWDFLAFAGEPYEDAKTPVQSGQFSWSDCGASSDSGHITALSITPDPIVSFFTSKYF